MKNYVFEKNVLMPLCCVEDDIYFDYLIGEVITNEKVLNFIKNGLKNKTMEIKSINLMIYEILGNEGLLGFCLNTNQSNKEMCVGYNYCLNGISNFLDINKQPLNKAERQFFVEKIVNGSYKQNLIWGDINE